VKKNATGLVARLKEELGVTPIEEKGEPGEIKVFVGDEQVAAPTGFFAKLVNKTQREFFAEVSKRLEAP
jgi:hypothetical protein